ncbi:MAG: hypothetical protein ACERKD_23790 [Prolixibacteraceae bacterium]
MIRKLLDKYNNTSDLNRFLVKGGALFLAWRVFRKWMMLKGQSTDFTQGVSTAYLWLAKLFLRIFGVQTTLDYPTRKLWINGANQAIEIVYDCLGVNLFFVFLIFMLAYPGKVKIKLWMVPVGFVLIFLLNAMRMAALTKILACCPQHMDLFHHFIFQGIIYLGIFGMWWWFTSMNHKKRSR